MNKLILALILAAAAVFTVPAMAQDSTSTCPTCDTGAGISQGTVGSGGVDMVGAIYEAGDEALSFPLNGHKDTNVDFLEVGNDKAKAISNMDGLFAKQAVATNNLEIKKNQDTECSCCNTPQVPNCQDCCQVNNIEKVKIQDRTATAIGFAVATNNVKVLTNQQ